MKPFEKISKLITQYFTVWLVLCSVIAFFFPSTLKLNGDWITNMLCLIMLGMGLTMKLDDFKLVFAGPRDVIVGIILRYTIMPLVGFCVAQIMGLPPQSSCRTYFGRMLSKRDSIQCNLFFC
jgi:BASS family bile acid:Na+ symporter